MIVDAFFLILQGIVNVLLAPLTAFNIGIDFLSSIPVVASFLNVIFYVLPTTNLLPLFTLVVVIINFKIVISLIKTIWELLPIL